MELTYSFKTCFGLHNRKYAKNDVDAKNVVIKLKVEVAPENVFDLRLMEAVEQQLLRYMDKGAVIQRDDPYLIHLLEPKSGATVHDFLNELRALGFKQHRLLGETVPPETLNGYKVLVLGEGYTATLEGIAEFLMRNTAEEISEITIYDGDYTVRITSADVVKQLL